MYVKLYFLRQIFDYMYLKFKSSLFFNTLETIVRRYSTFEHKKCNYANDFI